MNCTSLYDEDDGACERDYKSYNIIRSIVLYSIGEGVNI